MCLGAKEGRLDDRKVDFWLDYGFISLANSAALAVIAAKYNLRASTYKDFARKQIHYMLGDFGRSLVVGYGNNPPQRPHHGSR